MYVCICKGITDQHIRDAVENGTGSFRELRQELELASQCGKCGTMAREIFDEHLDSFNPDLCYAVV